MSLVEDERIEVPQPKPELQHEALASGARVDRVIGVVSGKGGVGKSFVSSMLAVEAQRAGKNCAILDADVTGPSIPKCFGLSGYVEAQGEMIIPKKSKSGIQVVSTNFFLEDETEPVIWRGPILSSTVKQFWGETLWDNVELMIVDMPPGTGDVPLTVFQSLPIDGIVIVTSPQDLVSMVVKKALNMAAQMDVPVLGIVENMASFTCPDCGKTHAIFGEGKAAEIAEAYQIQNVVSLPIDPAIARLADEGRIEEYASPQLASLIQVL
ncbi:MAG: P-loop NTPase [Lachnospiraceae bacterium]|nr:P-loop NTPase [Lachnospiraceae bacterium]